MKQIVFLTMILSLFACTSKKSEKKEIVNTTVKDTSKSEVIKEIVETEEKEENRIFFIEDSVKMHSAPCDTCPVVDYGFQFESLKNIDYYATSYGVITPYDTEARWFGILYKDDTVWVKKHEGISFKLDVDTINNIQLIHVHGIGDWGGIYQLYSFIKNIKTNEILLRGHVNKNATLALKDSLCLINYVEKGELIILNSINCEILYRTRGFVPLIIQDFQKIFFRKEYEEEFKRIPFALMEYNYGLMRERTLYQEPDDSTLSCIYFDDGGDCEGIELHGDRLLFRLFKYRKNPVDEGDVYKIDVVIDTTGKFIRRDYLNRAPGSITKQAG